MKRNRKIIYLFLFLLMNCGKPANGSQDIELSNMPIKLGQTSLNDVQATFGVEPCNTGSGDYTESMDCYSIKLGCWNPKIDYLFIVFTFNHDTQKLIGLLLNSKLKKDCNLSIEEMERILKENYQLNTAHLITNGSVEYATFTERFWVSKIEHKDTHFYYDAQLNDAGYEKFNLKKAEMD